MRAPNTPVATSTPSSRSAAAKRSYSGSACSGRAASEKLGRLPSAGVGDERELRDDERRAAGVEQRAVELAVVALEDPQARDLAGEPLRGRLVVRRRHAEEHAEARADLAARRHARAADALHDRAQRG